MYRPRDLARGSRAYGLSIVDSPHPDPLPEGEGETERLGRFPATPYNPEQQPKTPVTTMTQPPSPEMSAECPAPAEVQPAVAPPGGAWETVRGGLWTQSFLALLVTQFLVTLNDNMFRWLVIPIGKQLMGEDNARVAGSISFLLPFVLLAAPAGYLADRFSKRNVIVGCKVAEIVIVALGVLAILSGSVILDAGRADAVGLPAALFSPAKMGSIPEIVRADQISAANGWIGLTSMVGIILGSVAGGYLFSLTTPSSGSLPGGPHLLPGQHHWWILGRCALRRGGGRLGGKPGDRPAAAGEPRAEGAANLFGQTLRDLRTLIGHRPLLLAASAASFFWRLGLLSQLNIDKFALSPPQLVHDQQYVGYLLAVLTLGIGVGSLLAGIWLAGKVEVGLVPFGAGDGRRHAAIGWGAGRRGDALVGALPLELRLALGSGRRRRLLRHPAGSVPATPQSPGVAGEHPGGL